MIDIVQKLRAYRPRYGWPEEYSTVVEPTMNHVAADEIERLRAALTAILFVTEQLCETLDVDTYEPYIRVKEGKSGETIARLSVAEIVQAGHYALGEEEK